VGTQIANSWRNSTATIKIRISDCFFNYKLAMNKDVKIRQGWKKPSEGYISLHIDASFDEDNGCGNTGAIIRGSSGGMIVASNTFISYLVDAPIWPKLLLLRRD
jgi:hypothetical protein